MKEYFNSFESRAFQVVAADGHTVPAAYWATGSDRIAIMSHGITGDRDEDGVHSDFATLLAGNGFDSVRFDFRGRGQSVMPCEDATAAGMVLDFMAILQWVRSRGFLRIFHVATSFGAGISLLCASRFSFSDLAAAVFWNPVIDFNHVFINPVGQWGRKYFRHQRTDELAYSSGIPISDGGIVIGSQMLMELLFLKPQETVWPASTPLLIVHGDRDSCSPYEDAVNYRNSNPGRVELYTLAGADHGFEGRLQEAYEVTLRWFSKYRKSVPA